MIDTKHIIASIVEEKKKNNKEPAIAHFTEIQATTIQALKDDINRLCKTVRLTSTGRSTVGHSLSILRINERQLFDL